MNKIYNLDNLFYRTWLNCRNNFNLYYKRLLTSIFRISYMVLFVVTFPVEAQTEASDTLNFSGDFRLRFERTSKQEPGSQPDIKDPRYREVVRFRMGINRKINGLFKFGTRFATGSADDPNTADITLGDFVNDLTISLDKVYLEFLYKDLLLTGGKFGNPFLTTDLVWDGDVNPQGAAGSYTLRRSKLFVPKFTGIYYVVDEQTSNPDSYMWGGQMQLSIRPVSTWSITLAAGYYDYFIKSLTNANAGDTRSNNTAFDPDSNLVYLSDFNLVNIIAILEYPGLSDRFPFKIVGDFVKNNGAKVSEDQGFAVDLFLGKAKVTKDMRFQYGYAKLETDAVLAAFSHDNTTIATNYEQHTIGINYVVVENTILNLTFYHYRANKVLTGVENDFFSRLRLNAIVTF